MVLVGRASKQRIFLSRIYYNPLLLDISITSGDKDTDLWIKRAKEQ